MLLVLDLGGEGLIPHRQIRQRRAQGLALVVPPFLIDGGEAGKAHTLMAGPEHMTGALRVDRHRVIDGAGHLGGQEAAPNELIELILVGGQAHFHPLRVQLHMRGPDGLVAVLGPRLCLKLMEFSVVIAAAVPGPDEIRRGGHGLRGQSQGVGTHIGDDTCGALPFHIDALIELLGNHHGLFGGEAQLPGGLLL